MTDNPQPRRYTDNQWHLDKRVPVALIVTLCIQAGLGIWWASALDAQQTALTDRVSVLEGRNDKIADQMRAIEGRLARVEANGEAQLKALERIYDTLSRRDRETR